MKIESFEKLKRNRAILGLAGVGLALALATAAQAQDDKMVPIAIPAQPRAIQLNTAPCPARRRRSPGTASTRASSRATSRSPP